jgi:hypothetical protein
LITVKNTINEKTAVELLEISLLGIVSFDSEVLRNKYKERFKIAKEMEKEQIIDAHGAKQYHKSISGEQYYNETLKTKQNDINRSHHYRRN